MSCKYTAHLSTPTGALVKMFYADAMHSFESSLVFRVGHRATETLPASQVRMLFRDADDRVGIAQKSPVLNTPR